MFEDNILFFRDLTLDKLIFMHDNYGRANHLFKDSSLQTSGLSHFLEFKTTILDATLEYVPLSFTDTHLISVFFSFRLYQNSKESFTWHAGLAHFVPNKTPINFSIRPCKYTIAVISFLVCEKMISPRVLHKCRVVGKEVKFYFHIMLSP